MGADVSGFVHQAPAYGTHDNWLHLPKSPLPSGPIGEAQETGRIDAEDHYSRFTAHVSGGDSIDVSTRVQHAAA